MIFSVSCTNFMPKDKRRMKLIDGAKVIDLGDR
jgi:hypothetical protein